MTTSPLITPSLQQSRAISAVTSWFHSPPSAFPHSYKPPSFLLSGQAGTGKTTIATLCTQALNLELVAYGAYTGKAARVMQSKGMEGASTIHRMLFKPIVDSSNRILGWKFAPKPEVRWADLIVIDEVSMLSDELSDHLLSLRRPILVLGDVEGQLPPIEGTGAFVNRKPDFTLTEIHRTALTSPITQLARFVRNSHGGKYKGWGFEDEEGLYIGPAGIDIVVEAVLNHEYQAIVGLNKTRTQVISAARKAKGFNSFLPEPGEPLICLKNNYNQGLLNGDLVTMGCILREDKHTFLAELDFQGETILADIYRDVFESYKPKPKIKTKNGAEEKPKPPYRPRPAPGEPYPLELDFSYAITCHKFQGSEHDNVIVIDDGIFSWDHDSRRRWMYTAISRAKQNLSIVELT